MIIKRWPIARIYKTYTAKKSNFMSSVISAEKTSDEVMLTQRYKYIRIWKFVFKIGIATLKDKEKESNK